MEITQSIVDQWAANKFEGIEKPQLRQACRLLELDAPSALGLEGLKLRLLQHYGMDDEEPSIPESNLRMAPNLRQLKGWQGRRYQVKAHPLDRDNGNRKYPIIWEGQVWYMDPKKPFQDVPAPIWHIINDAVKLDLKTEWNQAQARVDAEWIEQQRIPVTFLRITPGTENLPESLIDWYKQDFAERGVLPKLTREELGQVWGILTDQSHPNEKEQEWSTDRWRYQVAWLLEMTPEQIRQKNAPKEEEQEEEFA